MRSEASATARPSETGTGEAMIDVRDLRRSFGAFSGASNASLLLLYVLCGVALAMSIGLLLGTMLETAGAAGGPEAVAVSVFIIPAIFVPLTPYLNGNAVTQIIKVLPTYYVAGGVNNALQNQGLPSQQHRR